MSKILFSDEKCFGCGACINIAPDNFTYSDDGRTVMISDEVSDAAIEASEICPARAIEIKDSKECTCGDVCNCDENNNCGCGDDCNCGDDCDCEGCNCSK